MSTWVYFGSQNPPESRHGGLLGRLGRVLGRLGRILERLGGLLGRLGGVLERLGRILERLGGILGRLGRVLGRFKRQKRSAVARYAARPGPGEHTISLKKRPTETSTDLYRPSYYER